MTTIAIASGNPPNEKYQAEIRALNAQAAANEWRTHILAEINRGIALSNSQLQQGIIATGNYVNQLKALQELYKVITQ